MFSLLLLLFDLFFFQLIALHDAELAHKRLATGKPCQRRSYGLDSFVCVCSGNTCDSPEPIGELDEQRLVYYVSDKAAKRLKRAEMRPKKNDAQVATFEIRVDPSERRQQIFGFGGAFTDAVGVNLNALDEQTRKTLIETYFHAEKGIGYTVGRVPIASCDFSTREYSYLDTPNDFNLSTFALSKEDVECKIPYILAANATSGGKLRTFSSPWSAPGWMKTNGKMRGGGRLKGPLNGKYYRTYAHYFRRFFEEYAERNVTFWGTTIENEPGAGGVPGWSWQALYFSPEMQRDFASELLSPILKQSDAAKNVKIMAHDDQRNGILDAAKKIYADPDKAEAIAGLAFHWYSHSAFEPLSDTHAFRPDKFVLATEACTGYAPGEHKPLLGEWARGWLYAHDILNDLRNWAIGWTDWNLCLDLGGGPNWVKNFVDAPIIVNAGAKEFYKQPMFYALAHFSRFVPRGSFVLSSSLHFAHNGTRIGAEGERTPEEMGAPLGDGQLEHVAFETPGGGRTGRVSHSSRSGHRVLVVLNPNLVLSTQVAVVDGAKRWTLPIGPASFTTAVWKG